MLVSVSPEKKITAVPHADSYRASRASLDRVDPSAYDQLHAYLSRHFSERQVDTSSWIPGSDWTGTVYAPIYEACGRDQGAAAKFFGQLVWQVVMDLDTTWSFGKYEKDGVPLRGTTYFRIDPK